MNITRLSIYSDGRALKCEYMSKAFRGLLVKNDLPQIRLHDLRHSYANYMLKIGCSMKEIADWLGHADIQTAMNVYVHINVQTKKDTATVLPPCRGHNLHNAKSVTQSVT